MVSATGADAGRGGRNVNRKTEVQAMKKRMVTALWFVMLLALWTAPVYAAEAAGVNPPGWLGGALALLALVLPLAVSVILRRKGSL